MQDIVRVGIISSVDPNAGMAQVYYQDRESTTAPLHLFALNAEYALPKVGDQVVVLHLSNDTSTGIIMGRFWGMADQPKAEGAEYQKTFGQNAKESFKNACYTLKAPEIAWEGNDGKFTLSRLIELDKRVERLERVE